MKKTFTILVLMIISGWSQVMGLEISLSATALSGFGNVALNSTSHPNSFTINGINLTSANVTVGALGGFTYSVTSDGTYRTTLSLPQSGSGPLKSSTGEVGYSQIIYAKSTPTAAQSYAGNNVIGGGGAASINVDANGSATAPDYTRLFVTIAGAGTNDGSSWENALDGTQLQAAINATGVLEVWVAKGTYIPTVMYEGTTDRDKTFQMKEGVAIYGGFSGAENAVSERNNFRHGEANETILSGDINGDDIATGSGATLNIANNSENCYNVIFNPSGLTSTAILDGFTITGGNANSLSGKGTGGGINNSSTSPTLSNLTIINNEADWCGGIYNFNFSSPVIVNTSIVNNKGTTFSGGLYNERNSSPILTNVLIAGNSGGGICNWRDCAPVLNNVTISNNSAQTGGGVYNYSSSNPIFNNCIIWGNTATYAGRQIYSEYDCASVFNNSCFGDGLGDTHGSTVTSNSIPADPLFVDATNGDFRIYDMSPCADAGDDSYNTLEYDIRGKGFGRKLNKTDGSNGNIDMGAYEYKFISDPKKPCVNPSTTGTITASQSDNNPFDAAEITSLTQPTGYEGLLEYQWQISTNNNAFVNIEGATSETYDPGLISQTTWFKRLVRITCLSDWSGAAESNVVKMAIVAPAVEVTASEGNTTPTEYATLRAAFDKINNGTHRGAITVKIIDNTDETATAVLYNSGYASAPGKRPGGSDYTSVNIFPTVTGLAISGNLNAPLIDWNGADNVTFNGSLNGLNAEKDLTIINSSISDVVGTSTLRFINDATADTVKYCTLKGSSTDAHAGIVFFSTTDGTTGNDSIVILNNDITTADAANRPINAIYSYGNDTTGLENSTNIIAHTNIYDFATLGVSGIYTATNGILLSVGSTDWEILGNSLYETKAFIPAGNIDVSCIKVANKNGNNFSISENFIGGSESGCSGSWENIGGDISFSGIVVSAGLLKASSIQGNTIRNFHFISSNTEPWTGMSIKGNANIGTIAGNFIGDTTGTGSVTVEALDEGTTFAIVSKSSNVRMENNKIGSFTLLCKSGENHDFIGIAVVSNDETKTVIRNNQVGSLGTAKSIQCYSPECIKSQAIVGIFCNENLSDSICGNIISGLNNEISVTSTDNESFVSGILYFSFSTSVISANQISNLSTNSGSSSDNIFPSISGITALAFQTHVSNNTITNLSNTNPDQEVTVKGLQLIKLDATADTVSGNYIGGLSIASSNEASDVTGISIDFVSGKKKRPFTNKLFADFPVSKLSKGSKSVNDALLFTTVSNNIIYTGTDFANTYRLVGISDNAPYYASSFYFNTVYVGGNPSSGSSDSYALYLAPYTADRDIRNNILVNNRSNSGSTGNNYALYFQESALSTSNLTLDYNDYYTPGNGGVLAYVNGASQAILPLVADQDDHSLIIDPVFANLGGATAASFLPSAKTLDAVTGTGITTDYAGVTRSLVYPAMGAWEFDVSPCGNPTNGGIIAGNQSGCSPFDANEITSSELPAGNTGSLVYQWQRSTDSITFGSIDGATLETYDPELLESTTWYKRLSRVACMSNWTGAAETNMVKIEVNSVPDKPAITLTGNTFSSNSENGNQWYLEGVAIEGATGKEYTSVADGNYTVIVTLNGCSSATSDSKLFLPATVNDLDVSQSFDVYPNPSRGKFTIKVTSAKPVELTIEIFSNIGIPVWKQEKASVNGTSIIPINPEVVPNGVYFVTLRNTDVLMTRKIVIMK